jgi:general nucleoside transport system permease protein
MHIKHGDATFAFSQEFAKVTVPDLSLPAALTCYVCGGIAVAAGLARAAAPMTAAVRRAVMGVAAFCFVVALLCWSDVGQTIPLNVVNLLQGTIAASIPLILCALAGCLSERSGVINIALEGKLLFGAFTAAIVASAFGSLWLGLISGSLAGGLLGAMLAVFAIRYFVDHVVLGVVLNVFAAGLTQFLYDRVLTPYQNTLNSPATFGTVKIPLLGDIPIIGPVFFDSTVFLYITYAMLILVQIGLFSTRWGLRVRAVGEHPVAAETVGIRVLYTRYRNVILAGLLAGIGGAYLSIGSVGSFTPNMSSGMGYIALAAVIFGRWTPLGSMGAALLFGFTLELQSVLASINVPIPSNILLMTPYVVTIIAVAGLVGHVRAPAADGQPYVRA